MSDDEELRWRLEVLRAQLEQGKIHIAEHLAEDLKASLGAVRYGPDGKIDLSTVDGRVRSLAVVTASLHQREQTKQAIPLRDIQFEYFKFIHENFGSLYDGMLAEGVDPHIFSMAMSRSTAAVADLAPQIPQFLEVLTEFWDNCGEAATYHLQDLQFTKGVFGGDLFPSYKRNIASSCGLYIDTIILACPFLHSKELFARWSPPEQVRYLVKHALNLLSYMDLALADIDPPILAIVPNKSSFDDEERQFMLRVAEVDAVKHAAKIFDRDFSSREEVLDFAETLDTTDKVVAAIANKDRLLFDTSWNESLERQIVRAVADQSEITKSFHPGQVVAMQCFGRMRQATDILLKSRLLLGTPLIDAETSWRYFGWKLEYNAAVAQVDDLKPLHMVRGLQRVGATEMEWLGNIPPAALIEMRKAGALEEIRSALSLGVEEIAAANPSNFFRTSDKIVENIQDAFKKHQEAVRDLRNKKLRFAGQDIGVWFAKGAVEIAAAVNGTPAFGVAAFVIGQVVDAPRLKEIPERFRTIVKAHKELKKSPLGLLFKHRQG